jgi:hypothetical protein
MSFELVDGYVCRSCADVAYAKRGIDPAHPPDKPGASGDAKRAGAGAAEVWRRGNYGRGGGGHVGGARRWSIRSMGRSRSPAATAENSSTSSPEARGRHLPFIHFAAPHPVATPRPVC